MKHFFFDIAGWLSGIDDSKHWCNSIDISIWNSVYIEYKPPNRNLFSEFNLRFLLSFSSLQSNNWEKFIWQNVEIYSRKRSAAFGRTTKIAKGTIRLQKGEFCLFFFLWLLQIRTRLFYLWQSNRRCCYHQNDYLCVKPQPNTK